jgi:photosystem II stability/assembly factor-like uncharacterized protein
MTQVQAQSFDVHLLKGLHFRNVGPGGMSGRVTAIAVVHAQPQVIYAGTASGGLWKSTSRGLKWAPIFDKQPVQSIGAVAVDQRNPSIVWAGTGEGNPRNSHNSGQGIFRSPDGGRTWQCMGLEKTRTIHRILIHPDNSDIVWVGALGSPWGPNPERGVFKTVDGGKTWDKVLFINDTTGCADLLLDPANPDKLYAAMWQYQRQPWTFSSGGPGSGLHISHDGGKTWVRRDEKSGLPEGPYGRIGLAICQSKPNVVYALVEAKKNAFYRSNDGGFTFRKQSDADAGSRPFYYSEIYIDPQNENRLYNLTSIVTMSEDAGRTFSPLIPWSAGIHPDHHAFFVHPDDPNFLIDGNDGGIGISNDMGKTWQFAANIPVSQFYHVHYDMDEPYNVMGGMQDNGSFVGPSEVWADGGIHNHHWREVSFGDGFAVMPKIDNPADKETVYTMSQGGALLRMNKNTGLGHFIRPLHPEGKKLRFNWNSPIAQDPHDARRIFFGSQYVHSSTDGGQSWSIISPDLTTNDTTKQQQAKSGGLTIDATAAENHTTLLAIAASPREQGVIWAGSDDGRLHISRDNGQTWTDVYGRLPEAPKGAWIPCIEVSRHQAGEALVVVNQYRQNDWAPYLYHTLDYGKSWKRIANSQNVQGHCLSIAQDHKVPGLFYLGTDQGLHISTDAGKSWIHWTEGLPNVPINAIKVHPREQDLILGTFGRSIWILDDLTPLQELARKGDAFWKQPFDLVSATPGTFFEVHAPDAGRFQGAGEFEGENAERGSLITLYFQKPDTSKATSDKSEKTDPATKPEKPEKPKARDYMKDADEKAAKADTVPPAKTDEKPADKKPKGKELPKDKFRVLVMDGADTLRMFTVNADTGLYRFHWGMDRNGVQFPSRRGPREDADLPPGFPVKPGDYKLLVQFRDYKDSTTIRVKADPRQTSDPAAIRQNEQLYARFDSTVRPATEAYSRLRDAKANLDQVGGLLKNLSNTALRDSLQAAEKPLRDSIAALSEIYFLPDDFKGLEHLTPRLTDEIFNTMNYIGGPNNTPGPTSELALRLLRQKVTAAVTRINTFLERQWLPYRRKVEAAQPPIFKELAPVRLD